MGFLMGSPFRLTLPHPAREGERRASLLKRHGVGEGESELGADFTSLVMPRVATKCRGDAFEHHRKLRVPGWLRNADVSGFCHPLPCWRVATLMYSGRKKVSLSYLPRLPAASHDYLLPFYG